MLNKNKLENNELSFYYLMMSQEDITSNQVLEEILREKATNYSLNNKILDFWITISPSLIEKLGIEELFKETIFYEQQKKLKGNKNNQFYGCLISTDKNFINWVKLRLGYFENLNDNQELNSLKSKNFVSDGVSGIFSLNQLNKEYSPLQFNSDILDPSIILKSYKKINSYFSDIVSS